MADRMKPMRIIEVQAAVDTLLAQELVVEDNGGFLGCTPKGRRYVLNPPKDQL